MEERKNSFEKMPHQLSVSNRELLGVEGVLNLASYDQEKIIVETSQGVLEVKGELLHIQQLSLDQGKVSIEGKIVELTYHDDVVGKKAKNFLGRLIK